MTNDNQSQPGKGLEAPIQMLPCRCREETRWLTVKPHMDHGEFGCRERARYVYCQNCWACGPAYDTDAEAIEGWNKMRSSLLQQPTSSEREHGINCPMWAMKCECGVPAVGVGDNLISRDAAMRAVCSRCANPERYGPPVPLEGSLRLFHFQISDDWNAGQCDAQAVIELPSAATGAGEGEERQVIDVAKQHDFIQIKGSDRCGLRGCVLGALEHAWIPPWPTPPAPPPTEPGLYVSEDVYEATKGFWAEPGEGAARIASKDNHEQAATFEENMRWLDEKVAALETRPHYAGEEYKP